MFFEQEEVIIKYWMVENYLEKVSISFLNDELFFFLIVLKIIIKLFIWKITFKIYFNIFYNKL